MKIFTINQNILLAVFSVDIRRAVPQSAFYAMYLCPSPFMALFLAKGTWLTGLMTSLLFNSSNKFKIWEEPDPNAYKRQ